MPFNLKDYPANWRDEIRPQALMRANYKCQFCGVRQRAKGYRLSNGTFIDCDDHEQRWANQAGHKIITIYLSVIHLDHTPMNCHPLNLKAACQKCHNFYDKDFRAANRLAKRSK